MAEPSLPRLDRSYLAAVAAGRIVAPRDVQLPAAPTLELPERVVQFGTGAFLRGFIEPFVDEANQRGHYNGRIVAVGSTGAGRDRVLEEQDGLYTLSSRGIVAGETRQEHRVIGSLSRALSAQRDWNEVLACARAPEIELIVSNTT